MADLTIVGGGSAARACGEILTKAGFRLRHSFEIESGDRAPVILGEIQNSFSLARQAIDAGRHVLIASPLALGPERLGSMLEGRKNSQAIFIWSERRYHPGYHLVEGLIEADSAWRPRFLRQETLTCETTSSSLARWRAMEAVSLVTGLAGNEPMHLSATAVENSKRNAPDFISMSLAFHDLEAFVHVGVGEAIERRETLLAASNRKAYVDELNQSMPVRIMQDESQPQAGSARWLSCPSPTAEELVRQQCLAFLDATMKTSQAQDEARLWQQTIGCMDAMEQSLRADGAPFKVAMSRESPRFRLILGRPATSTPQSIA